MNRCIRTQDFDRHRRAAAAIEALRAAIVADAAAVGQQVDEIATATGLAPERVEELLGLLR